MKRFLSFFSALLFTLALLPGCNKNSPKEVAKSWLNSFYHMDYEAAKKLSTDDTKNFIALLQQFSPRISDSDKIELKKTIITIKDVKVNGNTASLTYTTSEMPLKDQPLTLIKQGDKWLVEFSKSDHLNGATDVAPPPPPDVDSTAPPAAVEDSLADTTDATDK